MAATAKQRTKTGGNALHGQGESARQALVRVICAAGVIVSLVTVHAWTREEQGEAYLWATLYPGDPPPRHVWQARVRS